MAQEDESNRQPQTAQMCALCQSKPQGEASHIIPAFVFRYLKKTSPTKFLRGTNEPNRRVTDGPKPGLLCADCEDRFSIWEGKFATEVWYPLHDGDLASRDLDYGDWLAKFACSVIWRTLRNLMDVNADRPALYGHGPLLKTALAVWGDFLLGKRADVGSHTMHMLWATREYELPTFMDARFLQLYVNRAVDFTTMHSPEDAYVLVKFGKLLLAGTVFTGKPTDWRGTQISVGAGSYPAGMRQAAACVGVLFETAYQKFRAAQTLVSPRQKAIIEAEVQKVPAARKNNQ